MKCDRVIPVGLLQFRDLVAAGAVVIGYEYPPQHPIGAPLRYYARYFNKYRQEVGYYESGSHRVVLYATPVEWLSPRFPLIPLTEKNFLP